MSWTTASADLRTLLSDGPIDRIAFRKKVIGELNGTNTLFKTFEARRVTDFTTAVSPLGVYKNGVRYADASITADDPITGAFTLAVAPTDGDSVECNYYYQYFTDAELAVFLTDSCEWLGLGQDYITIAEGLRPSAKFYAGSEAYTKLASRWAERMSNTYLMEEEPNPVNMGVADTYRKLSNDCKAKATDLRDQYYTRQGQALAPLFVSSWGAVPAVVPKN